MVWQGKRKKQLRGVKVTKVWKELGFTWRERRKMKRMRRHPEGRFGIDPYRWPR